MSKFNPLSVGILLSGKWPGSGATRVMDLLSETLDLPKVSAGMVRRSAAHQWHEWIETHGDNQSSWDQFEASYLASPTLPVDMLDESLFSDDNLNTFNYAQKEYSQQPEFWEQLPEQLIYGPDLHPGITQGDLAVIYDQLVPADSAVSSQTETKKTQATDILIFRVLLTVDPDEAAKRVLQREQTKKAKGTSYLMDIDSIKKDNQIRFDRDWTELSKTYNHRRYGRPIEPQDLAKEPGVIIIDTTHLTADEVVQEIIETIKVQLEAIATQTPELALPVLKALTQLGQN